MVAIRTEFKANGQAQEWDERSMASSSVSPVEGILKKSATAPTPTVPQPRNRPKQTKKKENVSLLDARMGQIRIDGFPPHSIVSFA